MDQILQTKLSFAPWVDPRTRKLPGVIPFALEDWLEVDSAYGAQMALRDHLIATQPDQVMGLHETARLAALELLEMVLERLPALGFDLSEVSVIRPDGVEVPLDRTDPIRTLGRVLQCDVCLMPTGPEWDQ